MPTELSQNFRVDPADLPGEAVIFGCTSAMRDIRNKIDHLGSSDLPVLIVGENGTGKEVVARFLHTQSDRRDAPFVKLNCAAVPANLLESELFGCEKVADCATTERFPGLVEIAEDGTLFLDEIGEVDWTLQSKLLRLLQDGSSSQIVAREEGMGRARVICATNVDLHRAVELGEFRKDLFYRIDVVRLRLSSLRERRNDIPQLCEYFLQKLARQFNRDAPGLNPATLSLLEQWDWPGNLRELENWVARAVIFGDDAALVDELRGRMLCDKALGGGQRRLGPMNEPFRRPTSTATAAVILKILRANHWNRRKAAEDLNMSYRSLLLKLHEVGLSQRRREHKKFRPAR